MLFKYGKLIRFLVGPLAYTPVLYASDGALHYPEIGHTSAPRGKMRGFGRASSQLIEVAIGGRADADRMRR